MNYKRITREEWLALDFEVEFRQEIYAWSPARIVKAFGLPGLRPYAYIPSIFGEYIFLSDSGEVWTVYDRDSVHMHHGIEDKTPEQFWSSTDLRYLRIGGPKNGNLNEFIWWLYKRVEGMPHPELEMGEDPALTYPSTAIYVSKRDPDSCHRVALLCSFSSGNGSALCAVEFLRLELEHYVSGDYGGTMNETEKELLEMCRQLEYHGVEYVIVKDEA